MVQKGSFLYQLATTNLLKFGQLILGVASIQCMLLLCGYFAVVTCN